MHDSRSTHHFHGCCNPIVSDFWSQLPSVGLRVSSFVRLFSFSLILHVLLFLCRYSLPTGKEEDLSSFLLALAESSNLPFPRLMIEFRLARVVTYILTVFCRPVSISIPVRFGRKVAGVESTLITDYRQRILLFRCLERDLIYRSLTCSV